MTAELYTSLEDPLFAMDKYPFQAHLQQQQQQQTNSNSASNLNSLTTNNNNSNSPSMNNNINNIIDSNNNNNLNNNQRQDNIRGSPIMPAPSPPAERRNGGGATPRRIDYDAILRMVQATSPRAASDDNGYNMNQTGSYGPYSKNSPSTAGYSPASANNVPSAARGSPVLTKETIEKMMNYGDYEASIKMSKVTSTTTTSTSSPDISSSPPSSPIKLSRSSSKESERKRRKRINEKLNDLRSLLPSTMHMEADHRRLTKEEVLKEAIEYIYTLKRRISEIEAQSEIQKQIEEVSHVHKQSPVKRYKPYVTTTQNDTSFTTYQSQNLAYFPYQQQLHYGIQSETSPRPPPFN